MADDFPTVENAHGSLGGMDMLPKPIASRLPLLVTGGSQQPPDWSAANADGWMTYPRSVPQQAHVIADWRGRIPRDQGINKPVMQSLYIDLTNDPDAPPQPIHLGFRSGIRALRTYLNSLEEIGVNHVGLNLRFNMADIDDTLKKLADELLPDFTSDKG